MNRNEDVIGSVRCITETAVGILLNRYDGIEPIEWILVHRYGHEAVELIKADQARWVETYLAEFNLVLSNFGKQLLRMTAKELADVHFYRCSKVLSMLLHCSGQMSAWEAKWWIPRDWHHDEQ